MNNRETRLARTFVELSDTLVDDFDLVDFLSLLSMRCREPFEPGEVGFLLGDHAQRLRVVGSSSEWLRLLELFELQNDEGPCLDCYRTSQPVVNEQLEPGMADGRGSPSRPAGGVSPWPTPCGCD